MTSGVGWPSPDDMAANRVGWPSPTSLDSAGSSPAPAAADDPEPAAEVGGAESVEDAESVGDAGPVTDQEWGAAETPSETATTEPADEAAAPAPAVPPSQAARPATFAQIVAGESSAVSPIAPESEPTAPGVTSDVSRETSESGSLSDVSRETSAVVEPPPPIAAGPWPRPMRRRVMAIANQKGGVGKTTSTVNLAAALSQHGVRVLVIDLDPQGNASTAFSVPHQGAVPSVYDVLIGERSLAEVSVPVEGLPNLWCAPATIDLAGAEIELVSVVARESRLRRALESITEDVDYIFIDCPPSLGLLTLNAMVAASEVLIPIQCEFYALEGLSQLLNNVQLVKSHLNPDLFVSTILLTMYDARTRLADQVAMEVRSHFGDLVIESVIPRSVRISEAPGFGQTVVTFDPTSRGALAYSAAAHDLAQRGRAGAMFGGDVHKEDRG
jgi:chromosome partitioning protein